MTSYAKNHSTTIKTKFSLKQRPFGAFHYERFDDQSFREQFVRDFIVEPEAALGYNHFVKYDDNNIAVPYGALQLMYILPLGLGSYASERAVEGAFTFNAVIPTMYDDGIKGFRVAYYDGDEPEYSANARICVSKVQWNPHMVPYFTTSFNLDDGFNRYQKRLRRYTNVVFSQFPYSLTGRKWFQKQKAATFFYGVHRKNYSGLFNSNANLALDGLNTLLHLQSKGELGENKLGGILENSEYKFNPVVHAYRNRRSDYEIRQGLIRLSADEALAEVKNYYANNPLFGAF